MESFGKNRFFSTSNGEEKAKEDPSSSSELSLLKSLAEGAPHNAPVQAIYLRELLKSDPNEVIKYVEENEGKITINDDVKELVGKAKKAVGKEEKVEESNEVEDQPRPKVTWAQALMNAANSTKSTPSAAANAKSSQSSSQSSSQQSSQQSFWTQNFGGGNNNSNNNNQGTESNAEKGTMQNPLIVRTVSGPWGIITSILYGAGFVALLYLWFSRSGSGPFNDVLQNKVHESSEVNTKFADVVGNEEAKDELRSIVDYLINPEKFKRLNASLPKGILMVGPPGCGKTLLARSLAGEAQVPFYYASGSDFEEMFVGVGARRIRALFKKAKETAPCIVFIDEIDAVGGKRDSFENRTKMTLNQLLVELDGFEQNSGIVVIAATNLQASLDSALTRAGRFDKKVQVSKPDLKDRKAMISHYLAERGAPDVELDLLSRFTSGFTGADIFNMVNSAAISATRHNMKKITMSQLKTSLEDVMMGPARPTLTISPETKKITAFHESGHAMMALKAGVEIFKATLVPRGSALGMVSYVEEDEHLRTKREMLNNLDTAMGGRVAEEIIFGNDNVSQGASGDFHSATKIARDMVLRYGMSDKVGHISIDEDQFDSLGDDTKTLIESEVKVLLEEAFQRTKAHLTRNERQLRDLANALLEHQTLTFSEIKAVVSGQDVRPLLEKRAKEENELKEVEKEIYGLKEGESVPTSIIPTKLRPEFKDSNPKK